MRQLAPYSLWLGHVGDVRDLRRLLALGVQAIVDLALEEKLPLLTREMVYCRCPLLDGVGNPPWLLRAAVNAVAEFVRADVPTLVCCGAGLSRSPSITAAALARVRGCSLDEALALVLHGNPGDVSPGLWRELQAALV